MLIRPAAAAGTFYPASPVALNEQLDQLLAQYRSEAISNSAPAEVLPPKCLIVPHARRGIAPEVFNRAPRGLCVLGANRRSGIQRASRWRTGYRQGCAIGAFP